MGNQPSLPEKVYQTVHKNDVCGFQALVRDFGSGLDDPVARAKVLEYKDRNGRTPLLLAAARNHYQILQELISLGADVHYINPTPSSAGGALHEAAARRHEAAVELLLAAGANPFAANTAGRTPLDEAVLSGHSGVVRAIERKAEFTGAVAFKTRAMAGLSSKYKVRWAVLMPYYPFTREAAKGPGGGGGATAATAATAGAANASPASGGSSGGGAPPPVAAGVKPRRCLWLYKDQTSISPRCRIWVDGAAVETHGPAGTEGTLRLHTSHAEPAGDLATTYSRGYCISMRPADLTPAAAAVYHCLVSLINTPPAAIATAAPSPVPVPSAAAAQPAQRPALPASPAPPPPAVGQWPPPPAPGAAAYPPPPPASPPRVPAAAASNPFYPAILPTETAHRPAGTSQPAPSHSPYAPHSSAVGPCPMASPLTLYQQQQAAVAALRASPAVPPSLPSATHPHTPPPRSPERERTSAGRHAGGRPPLPPSGYEPAAAAAAQGSEVLVGTGGQLIGETFIENMAALPGESDEDFAARLASAVSATSGRSQQHLYPLHPQQHPHPQTHPQPQQLPPQHPHAHHPAPGQRHAGSAAGAPAAPATGNLINFQSDPGTLPSSSGAAACGLSGGYIAGGRPMGHPSAGHSGPLTSQQPQYPQQPQQQPPYQHPGHPYQHSRFGSDGLDLDAVNALIAAEAAAEGQGQAQGGHGHGQPQHAPAYPQPYYPQHTGQPHQHPQQHPHHPQQHPPSWAPGSPGACKPAPPSAPPADAFGSAAAAGTAQQQQQQQGGRRDAESDAECVICLSAPREVGLLHGDTVHKCVCRGCSASFAAGAACPLCRQTIERVLGVY